MESYHLTEGSIWYEDYLRQEFFNYIHKKGYLGQGATVAVLDTGCYRQHIPEHLDDALEAIPRHKTYNDNLENMSTRRRKGNRLNCTLETQIGGTHGTIVAGIVNLVAPKASIFDIKVGESNATTDYGPLLKALDSCVMMHKKKKKPNVISLSMGVWREFSLCDGSCTPADYVNRAFQEGILVVVASGNRGPYTIGCPACTSAALSVGAAETSDGNRCVSPSSSYTETKPDVVAPSGIPSTTISTIDIFPTFKFMSTRLLLGTSFAAPLVSGLAALLFGIKDDVGIVKQSIVGSSRPITDSHNTPLLGQGSGLVKPSMALDHFLGRI